MTRWKKAVSTAVTAAMLASLLATAAVSTVSAATDSTAFLDTCVPATCSVQADGISTIVVSGEGVVPGTDSLYITISGATFVSAAADFAFVSSTLVTAAAAADLTAAVPLDTVTVRAPAAAGTATISVYKIPTGGGNAVLEGTFTLDFYSSSLLAVSEANSTNKIIAYDATPTEAECTAAAAVTSAAAATVNAATLCVIVHDGNNAAINAPTVAATITPVGLLNGAQATSGAASATGFIAFQVQGSGLSGVATISVSVTVGTATTSFAPKTFTFTGSLASLVATNALYSIATSTGPLVAVNFQAKDAAGNQLGTAGSTATASTGAPFTVGTIVEPIPPANGTVAVTCGATAGSGTVTVKNGTVSSNAVTVVCAGIGATITTAFNKTSVAPGGTATFTATVKDSGGRPVADGTTVTAVANSGAVVDPTDGNATALTSNGVVTFTYIAPNSTGVATVTAFEGGSGSASASITVGAAAGTADSALGVTTSGPFSTTTKVQSVGGYVTFRFDFGATAAGKTVTILSATKTGTTWSSFTTLTARVANSSGVVYYYVRQSSATWKSYRAQESSSGAITPARQARWT